MKAMQRVLEEKVLEMEIIVNPKVGINHDRSVILCGFDTVSLSAQWYERIVCQTMKRCFENKSCSCPVRTPVPSQTLDPCPFWEGWGGGTPVSGPMAMERTGETAGGLSSQETRLYFQTLDNGLNVFQLETAVGAAIKCFEGAIGRNSTVA